MFKKIGYSSNSDVKILSKEEVALQVAASPEIVERLEKHARKVQALAPKSDDFLYFSIIFLKAAESALIDENGDLKKVGKENAWGYFDENWRWKGNVKPHKNQNSDIFSEGEIKKAHRLWISKPLCVDHQSDTVDGVRGIILDTHYDDKFKQVVGLCALDKINYPDLARKVATRVIRFGSMGTGVLTSVCFNCGHAAQSSKDYCNCLLKKSSYGEINVGLNPIEYSLVVQPAEPGAILLRCFASLNSKTSVLKTMGVDDIGLFAETLDAKKIDLLDRLTTKTYAPIQKILAQAFLTPNRLTKTAQLTDGETQTSAFTKALAEMTKSSGKRVEEAPELFQPIFEAFGRQYPNEDTLTMPNATHYPQNEQKTITTPADSSGTRDYSGTSADTSLLAGETEPSNSFKTDGVGPEHYAYASIRNQIKQLSEEIMNEAALQKRAEMRRRLAYFQGGSTGVEPTGTYKDQGKESNKTREQDKHLFPNPKNLGGTDGMVPGDKEVKEKQKRAELQNKMDKIVTAYHQGGADGIEPKTYKSSDYKKYWSQDKHMFPNPKNLGGTDGMAPGDKEMKEKQKRASLSMPLSAKFVKKFNLDGSLNKSASKFEVYSGDNLLIGTTAGTIYGDKLNDRWDFLTSKDYSKAVFAQIREKGLDSVAEMLTKSAQDMPPAGVPEPSATSAVPPMGPPDIGGADLAGGGMGGEMDEDKSSDGSDPADDVREAFEQITDAAAAGTEALQEIGGGNVEINVDAAPGGADVSGEGVSLAKRIVRELKTSLATMDVISDELALCANNYKRKLTAKQLAELKDISKSAMQDAAEVIGSTKALVAMANTISESMQKTAKFKEVVAPKPSAKKTAAPSEEDALIADALLLRQKRRASLVRKAMEEDEKKEKMDNKVHDGLGTDPKGTRSGVTTSSGEQIALKNPTGKDGTAPSSGNVEVHGDSSYGKTPTRDVAESVASKQSNSAADGVSKTECKEVADTEAKKEVGKHEDKLHSKVDDKEKEEMASKAEDEVTGKLKNSFVAKKASETLDAYRVRVRRAFDIGHEMQSKGLLGKTKTALDNQVDELIKMSDEGFESFKRAIAQTNVAPKLEKTAGITDLIDHKTESSGQVMDLKNALATANWSRTGFGR